MESRMNRPGELTLHIPSLEELWFKEKMLADPATMSYNHSWGGVIPFPEDKWQNWYDRWILKDENKRYYRYLQLGNGSFIGEVAYHYDDERNIYLADVIIHHSYRNKGYGSMGLEMLMDAAKRNGIEVLYDNIALDNPAITMFLKHGFTEEYRTDTFIMLKKEL